MKEIALTALAVFSLAASAAYADVVESRRHRSVFGAVCPASARISRRALMPIWPSTATRWATTRSRSSIADVPQADPAQSKALAQELVVKEGVQYLAGFYFTPDAMAVTPILKQGNVPMVVMNAATSSIVTKSPYVVRTSFTTWQTSTPIARVALDKGVKRSFRS